MHWDAGGVRVALQRTWKVLVARSRVSSRSAAPCSRDVTVGLATTSRAAAASAAASAAGAFPPVALPLGRGGGVRLPARRGLLLAKLSRREARAEGEGLVGVDAGDGSATPGGGAGEGGGTGAPGEAGAGGGAGAASVPSAAATAASPLAPSAAALAATARALSRSKPVSRSRSAAAAGGSWSRLASTNCSMAYSTTPA